VAIDEAWTEGARRVQELERQAEQACDDVRARTERLEFEQATAVRERVRTIPVLIGDAHLPAARDLPADIEFLTHRQFLHVRRRYVRSDVG
jgi:hypothetical protein